MAEVAVMAHVHRALGDFEQLRVMLEDDEVTALLPGPTRTAALTDIEDLRKRLIAAVTNPAEGAASRWERVRELQHEVDGLVSECLVVAAGAVLRQHGIDRGMCGVADQMLAELAAGLPVAWSGMTVPGDEERTSYRSGVIGLRCPSHAFWSLPVAVHELGHVVAQTMKVRQPGGQDYNPVRQELGPSGGVAARREELFADIFATCALGPAYPGVMVLTRFRPGDARGAEDFEADPADTATHPPPDQRAFVMFETLRLMDGTAGPLKQPYRSARQYLEDVWSEQLQSVGAPAGLTRVSEKRLRALTGRFWVLAQDRLASARHRRTAATGPLISYLRGASGPESAGTGLRVADVVSAAWAARCAAPDRDPGGIEDRALALIDRPGGALPAHRAESLSAAPGRRDS